jgi:hypothetical protein
MLGFQAIGKLAIGELSSSNATELAADYGTYAITWQEVTAQLGMEAELGTYTVTGQDVALSISMNAEQGSYTLTGQDASLVANVVMAANAATSGVRAQFGFSALGQVALGQIRSTTQNAYVVTGQNIDIAFSMQAEFGTYTLSGQTANLFEGYITTPDTGAYTLTGQDVNFMISMPADSGSYAVTWWAVDGVRRIAKIRAFPRVGNPTFSAKSTGRDAVKVRAYGG